mmetsp:Transcript_35792/g.113082  ORF Transcript_35792/g.113082 Transcript_35792/m.113082 type:complete len:168 (-) Transcript_35792:1025-1528(-)
MSGSVHFKFKSALNYDTVSFDGVFISVSELKKSIADKKHLPKGSEAELVVCDAQTNEEYSDDGFLLPKNTSVIVRRVPGLKPKGPLQAASACVRSTARISPACATRVLRPKPLAADSLISPPAASAPGTRLPPPSSRTRTRAGMTMTLGGSSSPARRRWTRRRSLAT